MYGLNDVYGFSDVYGSSGEYNFNDLHHQCVLRPNGDDNVTGVNHCLLCAHLRYVHLQCEGACDDVHYAHIHLRLHHHRHNHHHLRRLDDVHLNAGVYDVHLNPLLLYGYFHDQYDKPGANEDGEHLHLHHHLKYENVSVILDDVQHLNVNVLLHLLNNFFFNYYGYGESCSNTRFNQNIMMCYTMQYSHDSNIIIKNYYTSYTCSVSDKL